MPAVPITIGHAKRRLGTCAYDIKRTLFRRTKYVNFRLRFSASFDLDEKVWEDTIIHEMIHYYLAYTGQNDKTAHGRNFRAIMNDINSRFGRNITISYKPLSARHSTFNLTQMLLGTSRQKNTMMR